MYIKGTSLGGSFNHSDAGAVLDAQHTAEKHYYDDFTDDMSYPITNCTRFERRHDFSTFNMSNYMSCENCRHLSAESNCVLGDKRNRKINYGSLM